MARTKQTARKSTGGAAPRIPFGGLPKPRSPVADAWAIPEIAENILAHLPIQDLLLVQRVCSAWKGLITSSPTLQEQLFMRPRQPGKASHDVIPTRELNPLLEQHFAMWLSVTERSVRKTSMQWAKASFKSAPWADTVARLTFLRRDASWRKMLITQPPCTTLERVHQTHFYGGDSLSVGSVEREDGIRMGLFYDQAVEADYYSYMLMDGKIFPELRGSGDEEMSDVDDDLPEPEPQQLVSERLFGGQGKLTMCSRRTRGCVQPSWDTINKEHLEIRQFTSVGAEDVKIKLRNVESGGGYGWWTVGGYRSR